MSVKKWRNNYIEKLGSAMYVQGPQWLYVVQPIFTSRYHVSIDSDREPLQKISIKYLKYNCS